jgi:hypothetical protein
MVRTARDETSGKTKQDKQKLARALRKRNAHRVSGEPDARCAVARIAGGKSGKGTAESWLG